MGEIITLVGAVSILKIAFKLLILLLIFDVLNVSKKKSNIPYAAMLRYKGNKKIHNNRKEWSL